MDRSKSIIIEVGCLLVALFFFVLGKLGSEVFFIPAAIVSIGGVILSLLFNRCPYCGKSLVRHHFFIEYCPYCGGYL